MEDEKRGLDGKGGEDWPNSPKEFSISSFNFGFSLKRAMLEAGVATVCWLEDGRANLEDRVAGAGVVGA